MREYNYKYAHVHVCNCEIYYNYYKLLWKLHRDKEQNNYTVKIIVETIERIALQKNGEGLVWVKGGGGLVHDRSDRATRSGGRRLAPAI